MMPNQIKDPHQRAKTLRLYLELSFRGAPELWPTIPNFPPRWYQFTLRHIERRIDWILGGAGYPEIDEPMRERFWTQANAGRGMNEDQDAYMWRCWAAALELPWPTPEWDTI